jgi:hypothetical protein
VFVSPLGEDLHQVYAAVGLVAAAVLAYQAWRRRHPMRRLSVAIVVLYLAYLYPMHTLFDWDGPFLELCAAGVLMGAAVLTDAQRRRQTAALPDSIITTTAHGVA